MKKRKESKKTRLVRVKLDMYFLLDHEVDSISGICPRSPVELFEMISAGAKEIRRIEKSGATDVTKHKPIPVAKRYSVGLYFPRASKPKASTETVNKKAQTRRKRG